MRYRTRRRGRGGAAPARWPCCSGRWRSFSIRARTPGEHALRHDGRADPRRGAQRSRTRCCCTACRIAGEPRRRDARDERAHAARRAVAQRGGGAASGGRSPTRSWCSAATSTRGTWGRARWTTPAASVAAWEAVRLMKQLGLRPRRTVRVVGWTNEENGVERRHGLPRRARAPTWTTRVRDGVRRRRLPPARHRRRRHRLGARRCCGRIAPLLARIGADSVRAARGEADIGPLMEARRAGRRPHVDGTRYFWYHHTDGRHPRQARPGAKSRRCVATMAVMAYVIADLPDRLPSSPTRRETGGRGTP